MCMVLVHAACSRVVGPKTVTVLSVFGVTSVLLQDKRHCLHLVHTCCVSSIFNTPITNGSHIILRLFLLPVSGTGHREEGSGDPG